MIFIIIHSSSFCFVMQFWSSHVPRLESITLLFIIVCFFEKAEYQALITFGKFVFLSLDGAWFEVVPRCQLRNGWRFVLIVRNNSRGLPPTFPTMLFVPPVTKVVITIVLLQLHFQEVTNHPHHRVLLVGTVIILLPAL